MTTRYGRVPLWLYDAGVSLQAIATYGWLAGRYGHHARITPSYGTLAKELGVTRGTVFNHVKELAKAGAIWIVVSGADGQTTNEYRIAFDQPFPVDGQVTGVQSTEQPPPGIEQRTTDAGENPQVTTVQHVEQFTGAFSTLNSPVQPAERGVQPVGHDIDVLKTEPTPPPPGPSSHPADRASHHAQEEGGGRHADQDTPAAALLGRIDFGRPLRTGERERLAELVDDALGRGWSPANLLPAIDGDWGGVGSRVGVVVSRLRELGDAPLPPRPRASSAGLPVLPPREAVVATEDAVGWREAREALRARRGEAYRGAEEPGPRAAQDGTGAARMEKPAPNGPTSSQMGPSVEGRRSDPDFARVFRHLDEM